MQNYFLKPSDSISIYNGIGIYRNFIMGFAIIWIVLYHAPFQIHNTLIKTIMNRGYIGVDIFLLASGYGLVYSMFKDNCIQSYIKKRSLRILPEFFIIVIISAFLSDEPITIGKCLWECSTVGYWLIGFPFYAWYISLIVALYIIFPIIYHYLIKETIATYIATIAICTIMSILSYPLYNITRIFDLFSHIPVFITGALFAILSIRKDRFKYTTSQQVIFFILLLLACSLFTICANHFLNAYREMWNPFICWPFSISIVGLLIISVETLKHTLIGNAIFTLFYFLGKYSLEIYIIHGEGYFNNIDLFYDNTILRNTVTGIYIFICVILSVILRQLYLTFMSKALESKH